MKTFDTDPVSNLPPPADGDVYSDEEIEHAVQEGLMGGIEARLSGRIAVNDVTETGSVGASDSDTDSPQLELVTPAHVPRSGARREPRLRQPPRARTWRQKAAADQAPEHQRVTPHGHDRIPTVIDGGKTNRQ